MQSPMLFEHGQTSRDVQQRILRIYDHLYANGPNRTAAGIAAEVGKLLHLGMYLEEQLGKLPAFDYGRAQAKELLRSSGAVARLTAEVRDQFSQMNKDWALYPAEERLGLDDFDVAFTCIQLNGIVISDRRRDVFGDALELFRSQWAKRTGGQFFTDQAVTRLAMQLLEFDPRRGDDLVDICAGTGGFLLAGLNHIRELLESDPRVQSLESDVVTLAAKSIRGQEVDRDVADVANATIGSRLGAVTHRLVSQGDSLKPGAFDGAADGRIVTDSHSCAASNPPFGTKITVKDIEVLRQFDLARRDPNIENGRRLTSAELQPRAPDILFLERNVRILKPGSGRLAIVLPYQLLSGPQAVAIRRWLLRQAELLAVIDLPAETFQPHTGTKTSLVVVRRRLSPLANVQDAEPHPVFMAMPKWIGHDRRGNPVYRRAIDGAISGEILSDVDEVSQAFDLFKAGNEPSQAHKDAFVVSSTAVVNDPLLRINALFHRPLEHSPTPKNGGTGEWTSAKLGDLVGSIFFPTRFKRHYVDFFPGAVPFLGGSNISEITITSRKWLRPDDPKLNSLTVRTGWLLITRSGSTGIVSSVPRSWDGYAMSEHVIRIVPDPEKIDPHYLLAVLRTRPVQELLARGVFGSVIDEITPEFLADLEIRCRLMHCCCTTRSTKCERLRNRESEPSKALPHPLTS